MQLLGRLKKKVDLLILKRLGKYESWFDMVLKKGNQQTVKIQTIFTMLN